METNPKIIKNIIYINNQGYKLMRNNQTDARDNKNMN